MSVSQLTTEVLVFNDPCPHVFVHKPYERAIGGFNFILFGISLGIERRMIDIGEKITFYCFKNVKKCSFFAFAFKVCKSVIMTPTKFFVKNINMGIKNVEFYADLKVVDADFQKRFKEKKYTKNEKNRNTQNSHNFLAIAFLGAFVGIDELEISIEFCIFLHQY